MRIQRRGKVGKKLSEALIRILFSTAGALRFAYRQKTRQGVWKRECERNETTAISHLHSETAQTHLSKSSPLFTRPKQTGGSEPLLHVNDVQ